jgi:sulfoquinovosidase
LPIIRHTALVDPEWPQSFNAYGQWMIGDNLVFAPVVKKGEDSVIVYLPDGEWVHLPTGVVYEGRSEKLISSPIYYPAAFMRAGTFEDAANDIRQLYSDEGLLFKSD